MVRLSQRFLAAAAAPPAAGARHLDCGADQAAADCAGQGGAGADQGGRAGRAASACEPCAPRAVVQPCPAASACAERRVPAWLACFSDPLPVCLANGFLPRLTLQDKDVAKLMGRVFIEQAALNLLGSVLDTPGAGRGPALAVQCSAPRGATQSRQGAAPGPSAPRRQRVRCSWPATAGQGVAGVVVVLDAASASGAPGAPRPGPLALMRCAAATTPPAHGPQLHAG